MIKHTPRQTYLLFIVLYEFGLSLTFTSYVPYLRELGLGPSDVSFVNIGFWVALLACEIPTGNFADRHGWVRSIQVGVTIEAISALLYSTASGLATAFIYEAMIGVGMSFVSGALNAWLYNACVVHGSADDFRLITARGAQYRALSCIVGGLLGGFIGMYAKRLTWLGSGLMLVAAGIITFTRMKEERAPPPSPDQETTESKPKETLHPLRQSWNLLRASYELKWIIAAYLSFSFVLPFNHYWSPFFRSHIDEFWATILCAPMQLSVGLAGFFIRHIGFKKTNEGTGISIALFLAGIGLVGMSALSGISGVVLCLMLHEFGRGMFVPMLDTYTQSRIKNDYRATYASLQSFIARIGNLVVLGGVWMATANLPWDNALIGRVWVVSGSILTCFTVVLWIGWLRRPRTMQ
ncbi:MFS transporter [Patescibacteria group bacterium]|nr:MFS transporter [Patescibacteria group bacterium]